MCSEASSYDTSTFSFKLREFVVLLAPLVVAAVFIRAGLLATGVI